jgi:hypothetical protein
MPCRQASLGKDHNPFAFSVWLAGGGIQGGVSYGASHEWSYKVAEPSRSTAMTSTPPFCGCWVSTTPD